MEADLFAPNGTCYMVAGGIAVRTLLVPSLRIGV
jgi:hypothetical protein